MTNLILIIKVKIFCIFRHSWELWQPSTSITQYSEIQYSGGIGGGTLSKLAVKLPNRVTLNIAALYLRQKPKLRNRGVNGETGVANVDIVLVELCPKYWTQLLNWKPSLASAIHFVPNPILAHRFVGYSTLHCCCVLIMLCLLHAVNC